MRFKISKFWKKNSPLHLPVSGSQHSGGDGNSTVGILPNNSTIVGPEYPSPPHPHTGSSHNTLPTVGVGIAGNINVPVAVAAGSLIDNIRNTAHSTSNQFTGSGVASPREKSSSKEHKRHDAINSAAAPPDPSSLWIRTLKIADTKLREYALPALDWNTLTSTSAAENIQSIIQTLKTARARNEGGGEGDEKNESAGRERLGRILRGVEKYTKIVDTAVQHSPKVTALVWAGVRGILQISLNHLEAIECLEETMKTIMEKVSLCEFYAGIYAEATISSNQETLCSALPQFYAAVVVFSIKTQEYFSARWTKKIGNMLKPFDIEFGPFIEGIVASEMVIRECADKETMERIRQMATKVTENLEMNKEIHSIVLDEKTYELLKMLSPLEPLKRHEDIKSTRIENTGTWLLQHDSFCNWSNSTLVEANRVFCCYGMPGAGKTVISSLVIDNLNSRLCKPSMVGIACLYSDYRDKGAQTFVHILGSLLQQFLSVAIQPIPQEMLKVLEGIRNRNSKPSNSDLLALLKTTLQHLECTFICIDALDELEAETRSELLQAIKDLSTTSNSLRVFLTGRKYIREEVQRLLPISKQGEVEIIAHPDDIREYLKSKIAVDANREAMDNKLETEIITSLVERSHQMFLLPALHVKEVLGEPTKSKRRKALQTLPRDLDDTFKGVIARIQKSFSGQAELGMQVLLWLHVANRPFQLAELQHALSVEVGQTEFDVDNIPSQKTILECCLGLVILDEETKTIRFVHYTLEEYFRNHGNKYFPNGYRTAAEICLTYLNFAELAPHCTNSEQLCGKMEDFAFLKYAASNWGFYVARQCNDTVKKLTLELLKQTSRPSCPLQAFYCLSSTVSWEYRYSNYGDLGGKVATQLSGIHVAACFGLVDIIECLFSATHEADWRDDMGRTSLSWAAEYGHEAVVRLLLARDDVDVNAKDSDCCQTPLSWAAENGHEAVVRLLLARDDVGVNAKDAGGRTPLSWAAENVHEAVVRLLLARDDVDVNEKDVGGRTPLSWAAQNGHEAVVRLLLARDDVGVNAKDSHYGQTPLSWAAEYGHEAVVRLLLARDDMDVNEKDAGGRTPLSWAAENVHEAVVRLLLARDDVDGHEAVVRLLLARDNVGVNAKDSHYGQTPLSWAARHGHEAVVRLLLERDDVDVNEKDAGGKTPLALAARRGHEAVVRLLLARDDMDVNEKDADGRTAADIAMLRKYDTILALLLSRTTGNQV